MSDKKGRKVGRNKKWCEAYRNRGQQQINKAIRLLTYFYRKDWWDGQGEPDKRLIPDVVAYSAYDAISPLDRQKARKEWRQLRA